MKLKNLLVICNSFPDEGNKHANGIFIKEQLNYLKKYFENIYVISSTPFGLEFLRKTKCTNYTSENMYVYFPKYFNFFLNYFYFRELWIKLEKRAIIKLLRKENIKFDLIHAHYTWPSGSVSVELKDKFDIPVVITEHTSVTFKKAIEEKDPIYINSWNKCNHIVRVRKNDISLFNFAGIPLNKVTFISNGYDDKKFAYMDKKLCRYKLNLPQNIKIVLNVGNFYDEIKGHKYLIDSMYEVIKSQKNVLCIIVGGGRLRGKLEKQLKMLNLEKSVKLVGPKAHSEIPLWMNACDLFVLPSINEGNPTVMFEALGCGKYFIGTKVGGIPEIIINENLGMLVEPKDKDGLAKAILQALEKEQDSEYISEYAKQFTWENIAKELMCVYELV